MTHEKIKQRAFVLDVLERRWINRVCVLCIALFRFKSILNFYIIFKNFYHFWYQTSGSGSGSPSTLPLNAGSGPRSALEPMRIHNTALGTENQFRLQFIYPNLTHDTDLRGKSRAAPTTRTRFLALASPAIPHLEAQNPFIRNPILDASL
jgi:hypothetical protein